VKSADVSWPISDDRELRPLLARNALNNAAPTRAIEVAVGVTAALHILRSPTVQDAGHRARPFIEGQNADTGSAELRSCPRDGIVPAAIAIEARSHDMGPELQLRYRTAVTMPCVPDLDAYRVQGIAAALPAVMWPAWSDRLLLDLRKTTVTRMTLACATLLAGSTVKTVAAARLLGEKITANALNHRLWMLRSSAYWQPVCAALIRLSDYLDGFGAPINYQRRRDLDYSGLLRDDSWGQVFTHAGDSLQQPRAAVAARCYLVEKLSGSPAPGLLALEKGLDERALTRLCSDFRKGMSTRREALLDDYAEILSIPVDEVVSGDLHLG